MWNIDEFLNKLDIDFTRLYDLLVYDPHAPMIFSSGISLWLSATFIVFYLLLQRRTTVHLIFVILFPYYFYHRSNGIHFFLPTIATISDFFIARPMERATVRWQRKTWVAVSPLINLELLCYFKYTNFLCGFFASLIGGTFTVMGIFLLVGISFFTFQSLSYTTDVYREEAMSFTSLLDHAFYASFFPQLVAGSIVRARDFVPQIRRPLFASKGMFGKGIFLIVSGLLKKAVISDYISINFVERIFDNPILYSGVENLMGIYGYMFQVYCDLSGYSDMAIGIALLLSFHFNMNLDSPYKSVPATELWRRWYIPPSSWLRDYPYISLGGNRKGKIRQYASFIITMFLGGLWHGASWNFVFWEMLHGVVLVAHKFQMGITGRKKGECNHGIRRLFDIVIMFHFVCLCWILFRNADSSTSLDILNQIFTTFHPRFFTQLVEGYWEVFALMSLGFFPRFVSDSWERVCYRAAIRLLLIGRALLLIATVYLVIQTKSLEIQPFIYFQL